MKNPTFAPKSPTSPAPYHKAGKMELAHVPSEHAHRIIAGSGVGDTGSASSKNATGGAKIGKSKGGARYAGNINTH